MLKRHALHHQLGHTLGRAHDIGWVHGFVGRNQYKFLRAALARNARRVQRAQNVGTNGFDFVVRLHEGYVFVSRCMKKH